MVRDHRIWRSGAPASISLVERFIPATGERDYPWSWEMCRSPEDFLVFGHVRSLEGHRFALTVAPRQNEKGAEYTLDADIAGSLRVTNGWLDRHRTQRAEALASLQGLRLAEVQAKKGPTGISWLEHGGRV
jgi:hypothetical protein